MGEIDDFTLGIQIGESKWLVDDLIPLGHLSLVIAQAGVGKSYWAEQLAICIVYGEPFMGIPVRAGNVLIIDEDTPEKALLRRLHRFMAHYKGKTKKGKLRVKSMTGLKLSSNSLMSTIVDNDDATLVIIDSLNAISTGLDTNTTMGMSRLQRLKQYCLTDNMTILVNHHISEKKEHTAAELMTCNPHELAMGSSVINQQIDSYYVLGSPGTSAKLEELYVRPIGKRELITRPPFKVFYIEEDDEAYFTGIHTLDTKMPDVTEEIQQDITTLYTQQDEGKQIGRTVKEIYEQMQGKHSIQSIRDALKQLEIKGKIRCRKTRHNLFHYEILSDKIEWPSPAPEDDEPPVRNEPKTTGKK